MISPRSERTVPGMGGKVFDFRRTGLCPPNGGRIRPLLMVRHIPVVPQQRGTGDLVRLGEILRGQGLAIQAATDAEGNVALYTRVDELCFGHRGANQLACGVEHMHFTVGEPWTENQMRAAAWCTNRVWNSFGIRPRKSDPPFGRRPRPSPASWPHVAYGSVEPGWFSRPLGSRPRLQLRSHVRARPPPGASTILRATQPAETAHAGGVPRSARGTRASRAATRAECPCRWS